MKEKIYKTVGNTGIGALILGIIIIVTGITAGILLIIGGVKLHNAKKEMLI